MVRRMRPSTPPRGTPAYMAPDHRDARRIAASVTQGGSPPIGNAEGDLSLPADDALVLARAYEDLLQRLRAYSNAHLALTELPAPYPTPVGSGG